MGGPVWTSRERRLLLHNHYQSRLVVQPLIGIQIRGYNINVNEVTSHLRADGQARPRPPPRAAQAGLCEGVREVAGFPGHLQALWHCAWKAQTGNFKAIGSHTASISSDWQCSPPSTGKGTGTVYQRGSIYPQAELRQISAAGELIVNAYVSKLCIYVSC